MKIKLVGKNLDDIRPILSRFGFEETPGNDAELIIAHGGDGTMLEAEPCTLAFTNYHCVMPGLPRYAVIMPIILNCRNLFPVKRQLRCFPNWPESPMAGLFTE